MKKGYNGLQKNNIFINLMAKFVLFNVFFKFTLKMKEQKAIFKTADVKTS